MGKLVSAAERQLAVQLSMERDDRNKVVSALWARLEELNQQFQELRGTLLPMQLPELQALPAAVQDSLDTSRGLEQKVQDLMAQINEGRLLREGPPELISTAEPPSVVVSVAGFGIGGSLEELPPTKFDAIAALQTSVKDLDAKQQQLTKEGSNLKELLNEVHLEVAMNAIRASRVALQSTDLSKEERNQALAALYKKELECKSYSRKGCSDPGSLPSDPQLADPMAALVTRPRPVAM